MKPSYTPIEMATEWRVIPGWEMYEVSDWGHVRREGRIRAPQKTPRGRWQITLWDKKAGRQWAVMTYRLVCIAFHGPKPFEKAVVAHRDDDLDNNHRSNVRWTTNKENGQDKVRNGRCAVGLNNGAHTQPHRRPRGEAANKSSLTESDVRKIRKSISNTRATADRYGVSTSAIYNIRNRKTWKHLA